MTEYSTMTIGCDLGDRRSEYCVLNGEGEVAHRGKCGTSKSGFCKAFRKWPGARIVVETGTHSPWVSALLSKIGHDVIVANARNVHLISKSKSKSDKKDAELLARLGRVDPKLLSPITHRGIGVQRDLALVRSRASIKEARTKLINHIRGSLKPLGERIPKCTAHGFTKNARLHLPQEMQSIFEPVLVVIDEMTRQIKYMEKHIEENLPKKYPEMYVLQQVNGVGPLTSLTYILTIEDPSRFSKSRKVGAYLGLRPVRKQSGKGDPELRISKTGDKYLRTLMVNCANHILGPRGKDSELRRWGLKLASRGKKNAKKRAIVAVARRLSVLLHRLWVTGEEYQAIGYKRTEKQT